MLHTLLGHFHGFLPLITISVLQRPEGTSRGQMSNKGQLSEFSLLALRPVCSVCGMDLKRSGYLGGGEGEGFPLERTVGCLLLLVFVTEGRGILPTDEPGDFFPSLCPQSLLLAASGLSVCGGSPASSPEFCSQTWEECTRTFLPNRVQGIYPRLHGSLLMQSPHQPRKSAQLHD